MFKNADNELLNITEFRFSLQGLLKHIENIGYGDFSSPNSFPEQPKGLAVKLYDFQRSSCQWMYDQESNEFGLNGLFWEEWIFPDNTNPMYYFPIGGEFRFDKPPLARGGLLCEEMGLG